MHIGLDYVEYVIQTILFGMMELSYYLVVLMLGTAMNLLTRTEMKSV